MQTVDFFTPIVDDPYTFGAIAAANSLSDVYAMGGRPISSLSILAYPAKGDLDDLAADPQGRRRKNARGRVLHPGRPQRRRRRNQIRLRRHRHGSSRRASKPMPARVPGDALVFTKRSAPASSLPLSSGALPPKRTSPRPSRRCSHSIAAPAKTCCLRCARLHRCHRLRPHRPRPRNGGRQRRHPRNRGRQRSLLPGAVEYARQGAVPGGLKNNREFVSCAVEVRARVAARNRRPALRSANFGRPPHLAARRRRRLFRARPPAAYRIGRVLPRREKPIRTPMKTNPIIVALDVDSADEARRLVAQLGTQVNFYKVGMELYAATGMEFVRELIAQGKMSSSISSFTTFPKPSSAPSPRWRGSASASSPSIPWRP